MQSSEVNSKERQTTWIREQHTEALKYLEGKGILGASVKRQQCRYLMPLVSVWHIEDNQHKVYWVISGDLPSDHVNVNTAPEAREALRHFSLKWQLQAEKLRSSDDNIQKQWAEMLESKADGLYKLFEDEKLWLDS